MPYQVKFDFARPISPRVVDILYISPPIDSVSYYSEVPTSSSGDSVSL
jgi:hypothetical protein